MPTEHASARTSATWDQLQDELFDEQDELEIEHRAEKLRAQVRAYRLADVRRRQHATQVEVARRMGISQSRVSDIERGLIGRSEVDTLAAYVTALGGKLKIVADFGDETLILS